MSVPLYTASDFYDETEYDPEPVREPFWKRRWNLFTLLVLTAILIVAAFFRFFGTNFDQGHNQQPDERFIVGRTIQVTWPSSLQQLFDVAHSPLNLRGADPSSGQLQEYPYGSLPVYLTRAAGWVLDNVLPAAPDRPKGYYLSDYTGVTLLGRSLASFFDLITIFLVFLIARRLYSRGTALIAAALVAFAVTQIQIAHFYASDTFLVTFMMGALYFSVVMMQRPSWWAALAAGACIGLAVASKVSVGLFALVVVAAVVLRAAYRKQTRRLGAEFGEPVGLRPARAEERNKSFWGHLLGGVGYLALAGVAAFLAFAITEPYVLWNFDWSKFSQGGLDAVLRSNPWSNRILNEADIQAGVADVPYTRQYVGTIPLLYHIQNLVLWGLSPIPGITVVVGFLVGLWRAIKRHPAEILLMSGALPYFYTILGLEAKWMRYMLPLVPIFCILGAAFVVRGFRWQQARYEGRLLPRGILKGFAWAHRHAFAIIGVAAVAGAFLWAVAFMNIYTQPHSRVQASAWIYDNIPDGAKRSDEIWDDALPFGLPDAAGKAGRDPSKYGSAVDFDLYNDHPPQDEFNYIKGQLAQTDYIILSSNRLYGSIPRLPWRYQVQTEFYKLLFEGKLGFEDVHTQIVTPEIFGIKIYDQGADESFTVYDHPRVDIFKKVRTLTDDQLQSLFSPALNFPADEYQVARHGTVAEDKSLMYDQPVSTLPQVNDYSWNPLAQPDTQWIGVLLWLLVAYLIGFLALPIVITVCRNLPDRGYAFAKLAGLLLVSWGAWILASAHLLPFTVWTLLLVILVVLGLSAICLRLGAWVEIKLFFREKARLILFYEGLFLLAFAAFLFIRMLNPDLWQQYFGGEKPMEFGFLNAVLRSPWMPPADPFFSGGYVNYYYQGHFIVASMIKLVGVDPAVGFNLAIPLLYALTFTAAASVVYNLVAWAQRRRGSTSAVSTAGLAFGFLAGFLMLVASNMQGALQVIMIHFPGVANGFVSVLHGLGLTQANNLLEWLRSLGVTDASLAQSYTHFDFWGPSRIIPNTINEFPYWTFLFADLHPHLINMPFTLLGAGLGTNLALSPVFRRRREGAQYAPFGDWLQRPAAKLISSLVGWAAAAAVASMAIRFVLAQFDKSSLRLGLSWNEPGALIGACIVLIIVLGFFAIARAGGNGGTVAEGGLAGVIFVAVATLLHAVPSLQAADVKTDVLVTVASVIVALLVASVVQSDAALWKEQGWAGKRWVQIALFIVFTIAADFALRSLSALKSGDTLAYLIVAGGSLLIGGLLTVVADALYGMRSRIPINLGWLWGPGWSGVLNFAVMALALGVLFAVNSWDFPTYMVLVAGGVLIAVLRAARLKRDPEAGPEGERNEPMQAGDRWLLYVTSFASVGLLAGVALLAYLPFFLNFKAFFTDILPLVDGGTLPDGEIMHRTTLTEFLVIWLLFVFIAFTYLVVRLWRFPWREFYVEAQEWLNRLGSPRRVPRRAQPPRPAQTPLFQRWSTGAGGPRLALASASGGVQQPAATSTLHFESRPPEGESRAVAGDAADSTLIVEEPSAADGDNGAEHAHPGNGFSKDGQDEHDTGGAEPSPVALGNQQADTETPRFTSTAWTIYPAGPIEVEEATGDQAQPADEFDLYNPSPVASVDGQNWVAHAHDVQADTEEAEQVARMAPREHPGVMPPWAGVVVLAATGALVLLQMATGQWLLALLVLLIGGIAATTLVGSKSATTLFTGALLIGALAVAMGVELVYLADHLRGGGSYRMNTVFKFYVQVWVLFSLGGAAAVYEIFFGRRRAVPATESEQVSATPVEEIPEMPLVRPDGLEHAQASQDGAEANRGEVPSPVQAAAQPVEERVQVPNNWLVWTSPDLLKATPEPAASPEPEQDPQQTVPLHQIRGPATAASARRAPYDGEGARTEDAYATARQPEGARVFRLLARGIWVALFAVLVLASLCFTLFGGTQDRLAQRFPVTPPLGTLDGLQYMTVAQFTTDAAPGAVINLKYDYDAINWMNTHIKGLHVIAERVLGYYRENGELAAYNTGFPMVVGGLHQEEQRYDWQVSDRRSDMNTFFTTTDIQTTLNLINKYDIDYIYFGQLEQAQAGDGGAKFAQLADPKIGVLKEVFHSQTPEGIHGTIIYQVVKNTEQVVGQPVGNSGPPGISITPVPTRTPTPAPTPPVNDPELKQLMDAVNADPNNADTRMKLVDWYRNHNYWDFAAQELETLVKQNPNDVATRHQLGDAYEAGGHPDLALKAWQDAVAVAPNDPAAHNKLGIAYRDRKRYDDAVNEFKAAVQAQDNFVESWYQLGQTYELKGDRDSARQAYQNAVDKAPDPNSPWKVQAQQRLDALK